MMDTTPGLPHRRDGRRRPAHRRSGARRCRSSGRLARRFPLGHDRHEGDRPGRLGGGDRPRARPVRLYGARRLGGHVHGLHHLLVARRRAGRSGRPCREAPILVGSSMGGWIACLVARDRAARGQSTAGLVLIAPALDFTEELIWDRLSEAARAMLDSGRRPAEAQRLRSGTDPITLELIEDGRQPLHAGRTGRSRLSSPHPARDAGHGCPLHPRAQDPRPAARRGNGPDPHRGWRPSPVTTAGYRAARHSGVGHRLTGAAIPVQASVPAHRNRESAPRQ